MDPHTLANILKRPNYVKTIASDSSLDYLYEVLLENHESKNCEIYKVIHDSSFNEKHDSNIVSMHSLNIHDANDDCTSHDKKISYKHVNFCGVNKICKDMPYRDDRFCKKHKHDTTIWWLKL